MRLLSQNLLNAQNGKSILPYVSVKTTKGTDVNTYTTQDTTGPRILSVQDTEGLHGSSLLSLRAANGLGIPVSCIVTLLVPTDSDVFDTDFRGAKVDVRWGYEGYADSDGDIQELDPPESHLVPPYYVVLQRNVQDPRRPMMELYCISLWGLMDITAWHGTPGTRFLTGQIKASIAQLIAAFGPTNSLGVVSIAGNTDPELDRPVNLRLLFDTPIGEIIRQLLERTYSWLRFRGDGTAPALVPFRSISSPLDTNSAIYSNQGVLYPFYLESAFERVPVIPTRVLAMKDVTDDNEPFASARSPVVGIFGSTIDILQVIEEPGILSTSAAQTLANATVDQYEDSALRADIEVLMNVGAEPADIIELRNELFTVDIDNRRGRVERLVRIYDAEKRQYITRFTLGQINAYPELTIPGPREYQPTAELDFSRYARFRQRHNRRVSV